MSVWATRVSGYRKVLVVIVVIGLLSFGSFRKVLCCCKGTLVHVDKCRAVSILVWDSVRIGHSNRRLFQSSCHCTGRDASAASGKFIVVIRKSSCFGRVLANGGDSSASKMIVQCLHSGPGRTVVEQSGLVF